MTGKLFNAVMTDLLCIQGHGFFVGGELIDGEKAI